MNQEQILKDFNASLNLNGDFLKTDWEENSSIEFKAALHTKSEEIDKSYLSTIAGLANNIGGLIVFGIDNKSKELIGIKKDYENLDNRYVSSTIRQGLDGSLEYFFFTGKFVGKIIGFLYVGQAASKPIIVKVSSDKTVRGEIYYRYPAQTTRIEASDLRKIIEEEVANRLKNTLNAFNKVVEIGSDNLALINVKNGEIDAVTTPVKYTLDKNMLDKINVIKRGSFVEEEGAPAYIIKGELEIESLETNFVEKHVPTLSKETELYESFFSGICSHPKIMLEQLLINQSYYNPLFFFVKEAGLTINKTKLLLESIDHNDVIELTKNKVIERLESSDYHRQGTLLNEVKHYFSDTKNANDLIESVKNTLSYTSKNHEQQIARTICYNTLMRKNALPKSIYENNFKRAIEAMCHLPAEFVKENKALVLSELAHAFSLERSSEETSIMRKAICNIDKALYEGELDQDSKIDS